MRYAAPPLGPLRFRAPAEPLPEQERIQKAVTLPPLCLGIGMGYPVPGQSEDCLFVNVWKPANATSESKLPVWVFISGGGYVSLTNANWDGAEVVRRSGGGLVMVNFGYRVGIWGFLAGEAVRRDGDLNVGLLDQRMVLWWVKRYIAAFGGDPEHVVIHGASAGAGSVALHMVAHGGRDDGLFVGAVAESVFLPAQPRVWELEYQFDRVLKQTGCNGTASDNQMDCLRRKDVRDLQRANFAQPFPGRDGAPLFYWTPCIDGDFLEDLPYTLFRERKFVDVPVLFGTDTDEGSLFAPTTASSPSSITTFLSNNYPHLTSNHTTAILSRYAPLPISPSSPTNQHAPYFKSASQIYGDATFSCPNINILLFLPPHTPKYVYRYNVYDKENDAAGWGVPHLFEAAAVFGPDSIAGHARRSYYGYNKPMVALVMGYFVGFVRGLDPNSGGLVGEKEEKGERPVWERWDGDRDRDRDGKKQRLLLELGTSRMEVVGEEEMGRCEFWRGLGEDVMEQRV
ncbi:Alpha/Beta hydrolase protein [Echria macrotheca]|uniref:Carboxylic ester hydrolase n=1 Tax=Echria macrotheca TaxID=438768 RepID=A0AAJ0BGR0_9PEZI|nr:Alpha/Beta hydrolase protein [Echria macrotheca]